MTEPVQIPPVRGRTGQPSVAPDVGDAITGLFLLALPLIGMAAYIAASAEPVPKLVLVAFLPVYAAVCVIAVHGFLSDLTPWRVGSRFIPLPVLALGLGTSTLSAIGAMTASLPNAVAAKAAVADRIAKFESKTSSAASSASSAGDAAPAHTPPPEADLWDNFLATGVQQPIGYALLGVALVLLVLLTLAYLKARKNQLDQFPRVGAFDIPDHELTDNDV